MVFEAITDRIRGRGLLRKEPSAYSDETLTSLPEEPIKDLSDFEPSPISADISDEELEPSSMDLTQKSLKTITSPTVSEVLKAESVESTDETLEPYEAGTLSSDLKEEELLSIIPEEPSVAPKMPETPIPPKMPETPPVKPVPETTISDELAPEAVSTEPGLKEKLKSKVKTASEYKKSFWENIRGEEDLTEVEYARKGGYTGAYTKEELQDRNRMLEKNKEVVQQEIEKLNEQIAANRAEVEATRELLKSARGTERAEYNAELLRLTSELKTLEARKERLTTKIEDYEKDIIKNRRDINIYDEYVRKGKRRGITPERRAAIGKKLSMIGKGATETLPAGVFEGKVGQRDWFGPKGFLSAPYKQTAITGNIVEGVKPKWGTLQGITRSTGSAVGRGMVEAVTTVRANKSIDLLPGTYQGARKQFEYKVPAKVIPLSEMGKTTVNPDIFPSIYTPTPKVQQPALSPMEYKQVVQPDGTIINVPVTPQEIQAQANYRKSKIVTITVNRFARKPMSISHKMNPVKNIKNMEVSNIMKGIEGVKYNKVSKMGSGLPGQTKSNFVMELKGLGKPRTFKPLTIGKRPEIDLGIRSVRQTGLTVHTPTQNDVLVETAKTAERKSKQSFSRVDLDSASVISKNIRKLVSKKTKSK